MTQKTFYGSSLLVIFLTGLLSGCSPYVYTDEVGKFNKAIQQTSETFDMQRVFLTQAGLAIKKNALIEARKQNDLKDEIYPSLAISDECIEAVLCLEGVLHSPISKTIVSKNIQIFNNQILKNLTYKRLMLPYKIRHPNPAIQ